MSSDIRKDSLKRKKVVKDGFFSPNTRSHDVELGKRQVRPYLSLSDMYVIQDLAE